MTTALHKTGIDVVGDVPWGTHFCHFYDTKGDLLDTLVPYFKAGLEDGEFCVWVISEPITEEEAWAALGRAVPELDRYLSERSIEMLLAREWYLRGGRFERARVTAAWSEKLDRALARGYAGMRVSGNTAWLDKKRDWRDFCGYEEQLNGSVADQPMMVLCPYPLMTSGATELLDVTRTHQFAIAKRQGSWEVVETPPLRQARTEITRLHHELEERVAERTRQLEDANRVLRTEVAERERAEREARALRDELAADLGAMRTLHDFSTRLTASADLQVVLDEVLDATIALQHADFGNVQLYNPDTRALEIVAHRGFSREFLEYFRRVDDDWAACGRVLGRGERVIIEDVELDPGFAPHRRIAAASGFRAVQSTPLWSRGGEPLGMISTHFRRPHRSSDRELRLTDLYARQAAEIIEQRRAQDALRRSEEQFRLLTEAIPHQVWGYRADGSLSYCNQRWLEYRALTREEAGREGRLDRVHPDDVEGAERAWWDAAVARTPYEAEVRLRGADGSYRCFVSRAVGLHDERGQVMQWFGTSTDVEERRRAGEALHEAQAELAHVARLTTLGELAASLAHELNQPLAAVVTNGNACLRWLGRDQPNVDEAVGAVQRMIRDANRAADVIAHTRALVGKSNEERVSVDIGALIRDVLVLVRPEVARHRIDVSLSLADDLPPVPADRVQLQQVMLNLIVNGIEAMADVTDRSRELRLGVEPSEVDGKPAVLVAVRDGGVGVMSEGLARLFEAFYTTKPDGLGMGLSISRSLVQAHGGRLWATRNPGHGLTFQFLIPVQPAR